MDNSDIAALLGNTEQTTRRVRQSTEELAKIDLTKPLTEEVVNQTNDIMSDAKTALAAVLGEVQMCPTDTDLIKGASSLVNACTNMLKVVAGIGTAAERNKTTLEVTRMKIESDKEMNADNNAVKILATRREMKEMYKEAARKVAEQNQRIMEAQIVEEEPKAIADSEEESES